MTMKKRIHIIDPKTLRAGRSANDNTVKKRVHLIDPKTLRACPPPNGNETTKRIKGGATSQTLTPPNKTAQPCPASRTRRFYGLPEPSEFLKPGLLALVMDRFLTQDVTCDDFHHQVMRNNVVGRYQHALDLANDAEAFAAWKLEPRILGLSRKPKSVEGICRAMFQATHRDPKTASKRWKRIEHLWTERAPASKVAAFLSMRKPNNPPRQKEKDDRSSMGASFVKSDPGANGHAGVSGKVDTSDAKTPVHVSNLPESLISQKQVGDLVAFEGVIVEKDGNRVSLQLEGCS